MLFDGNYKIKKYEIQSPTLSPSPVVHIIILYPNAEYRTEISVKKLIQCDYNCTRTHIILLLLLQYLYIGPLGLSTYIILLYYYIKISI